MRSQLVGEVGLLVEPDRVDGVERALVRALRALPGVIDVVPAARTVMVVADPELCDLAAVAGRLDELASSSARHSPPARTVSIPVRYDGADLEEVGALTGLGVEGVIRRHVGSEYRVAFIGFSPGFPYLVGGDPALNVRRLATPRQSVPAGSVGLAGDMACIYPQATPGGWRIIGTTPEVLFDPDRLPPSLLEAGDRVRFVEAQDDRSHSADAAGPGLGSDGRRSGVAGDRYPRRSTSPVQGRATEVLRPGPLTTIQDLGRTGWGHLGVAPAGAVDPDALVLANRLVGNEDGAAGLECTLSGPELLFTGPAWVAVTGAEAPISVDGEAAPFGSPVAVGAGATLKVGTARSGLRVYLAVDGGIDCPPVMGSRSTDTLAGIGPPRLEAGAVIPLGRRADAVAAGERRAPIAASEESAAADVQVVRVVPGPRDSWLTEAGLRTLTDSEWTVSPASDRTGVRLRGPMLERRPLGELASEALLTGAVQVPPDGQPIVFLANRPTTGGYPVVAVVASADLTTLAQARPGTKISFVPVERAEALAARRQRRAALNPMSGAVPPRRRR